MRGADPGQRFEEVLHDFGEGCVAAYGPDVVIRGR